MQLGREQSAQHTYALQSPQVRIIQVRYLSRFHSPKFIVNLSLRRRKKTKQCVIDNTQHLVQTHLLSTRRRPRDGAGAVLWRLGAAHQPAVAVVRVQRPVDARATGVRRARALAGER